MNIIKPLLTGKLAMANYLLYSVIVTLIDTSIVWILVRFSVIHLVTANTIGVITGFIIHYILASKSVFKTNYSIVGFTIYLLTFLFGLTFANWLIYMCYNHVFFAYSVDLRILLSKGVSVILPFFALYYIRKYLFSFLKRREDKHP